MENKFLLPSKLWSGLNRRFCAPCKSIRRNGMKIGVMSFLMSRREVFHIHFTWSKASQTIWTMKYWFHRLLSLPCLRLTSKLMISNKTQSTSSPNPKRTNTITLKSQSSMANPSACTDFTVFSTRSPSLTPKKLTPKQPTCGNSNSHWAQWLTWSRGSKNRAITVWQWGRKRERLIHLCRYARYNSCKACMFQRSMWFILMSTSFTKLRKNVTQYMLLNVAMKSKNIKGKMILMSAWKVKMWIRYRNNNTVRICIRRTTAALRRKKILLIVSKIMQVAISIIFHSRLVAYLSCWLRIIQGSFTIVLNYLASRTTKEVGGKFSRFGRPFSTKMTSWVRNLSLMQTHLSWCLDPSLPLSRPIFRARSTQLHQL